MLVVSPAFSELVAVGEGPDVEVDLNVGHRSIGYIDVDSRDVVSRPGGRQWTSANRSDNACVPDSGCKRERSREKQKSQMS